MIYQRVVKIGTKDILYDDFNLSHTNLEFYYQYYLEPERNCVSS